MTPEEQELQARGYQFMQPAQAAQPMQQGPTPDEIRAMANEQQRQRMLQQMAQTSAALQPVQRAPAQVAPPESSWHQAIREFPGDVRDAYSPSGIASSAQAIGNASKSAYERFVEALAARKKE